MDIYDALATIMDYTAKNPEHSFEIKDGLTTLIDKTLDESIERTTQGRSNLNKIVSGWLNS